MLAIGQFDTSIRIQHPGRSASASVNFQVWHLVLAWIVLVPILYIAANGTFILRAGNVDVAATGQALGQDATHKFGVALANLICISLIGLRSSPVFALGRRLKLIIAFPLLAILSSVWSADPRQSIVSGVILMVFTAFAIYVSSQFLFQRQLELIMLAGAIALPLSIALALFVPSIGQSDAGWIGIFGHKQMCSAAAIFWLVTALHWKCFGIYQRMFRFAVILMCVGLIILSNSQRLTRFALGAVSE